MKAKYITKVDYIDSAIDFELGDNELSFALRMKAEYYKVDGGKETRLFSLKFWTDYYKWSIPPYDEDDVSEDDIIDWFNDNSLSDGIVQEEYPELWNIDFFDNDVPVVLEQNVFYDENGNIETIEDNVPYDEIESAIKHIWDFEEYELEKDDFWRDNTGND